MLLSVGIFALVKKDELKYSFPTLQPGTEASAPECLSSLKHQVSSAVHPHNDGDLCRLLRHLGQGTLQAFHSFAFSRELEGRPQGMSLGLREPSTAQLSRAQYTHRKARLPCVEKALHS